MNTNDLKEAKKANKPISHDNLQLVKQGFPFLNELQLVGGGGIAIFL